MDDVMFFQYIEHDNTFDEYLSLNANNIEHINIIFTDAINLLFNAYNKFKFIHHDLNLRNILITRNNIGYQINFIDFDDGVNLVKIKTFSSMISLIYLGILFEK